MEQGLASDFSPLKVLAFPNHRNRRALWQRGPPAGLFLLLVLLLVLLVVLLVVPIVAELPILAARFEYVRKLKKSTRRGEVWER